MQDGDGNPCADTCVEIWQSDPLASDSFPGFGRCATDAKGAFRFVTLKPGPVRGRGNTQQAPHIAICIMARGLMRGLVTRAYFQNEALNETDPLLMSIEEPARRNTLIARGRRGPRHGTWISGCRAMGRRCSWTCEQTSPAQRERRPASPSMRHRG